jgi:hypothetical protein
VALGDPCLSPTILHTRASLKVRLGDTIRNPPAISNFPFHIAVIGLCMVEGSDVFEGHRCLL